MILDKLIITNDDKFSNYCDSLTSFLENEIYSLDEQERSNWNEDNELNFIDFIIGLYLNDLYENKDEIDFNINNDNDYQYILKNGNDEFKIEFKYK